MPVGLADIEQGGRTDRTTVVVLSYIGKDRGHLIANGNFYWIALFGWIFAVVHVKVFDRVFKMRGSINRLRGLTR
jgi:hypothetical protein